MEKALSKADSMLSEKTGRNVLILVSHEDFSIAKSTAESVYNSLAASPFFLSITLNTNGQVREKLSDFLHKYRWNLFDDETIQSLESKDGQLSFVSNAMENILSPFTMAPLDKIDEDPFLFDEVNFKRYESIFRDSGMKMYPKDGVLASHFEGKWYILLNCVLSNSGAALASSDNGITLIYDVCNPLE